MTAIAQRYARAILSLAVEEKVVGEIASDLQSLAMMIHNSKMLADLLGNPMLPAEERGKVLHDVAVKVGAQDLTVKALRLLTDKGRLSYLPELAEAYQRLADGKLGRAQALLRVTAPLSHDEEEQILAALSKRTGKEITIETQIDPDLLGGVVASVGDSVFDSSVRSRLARLRQEIIEA